MKFLAHCLRSILRLRRSVVLTSLLVVSTVAYGQHLTSGFLFGIVLSGSEPLADVAVSIENADTGAIRNTRTNTNGSYRFARLPKGAYDVLVIARGSRYAVRKIVVDIGKGTRSDFDFSEEHAHTHGHHAHETHEHHEEVLVSTSHHSDIRGSFGEIHTVYSADEIVQLPVPRDINAVVNMAPGTVIGHSRYSSSRNPLQRTRTTEFGLVSIHGASIAENVYYIDGMNVSNLRNGLGASVLPFEFYDQVQLITGGLRAEFGRTTGGVVNAVSRSGTNEWKVRFGYFNEPRQGRGSLPDVADARPNRGLRHVFSIDEQDSHEAFVSIAGPIIANKLFIYGIYEDRRANISDFSAGYRQYGRLDVDENDDPFLGAKINLDINNQHSLALTYFSDESTRKRTSYRWNSQSHEVTNFISNLDIDRGGENYVVRYSGSLTEKLTIAALVGKNDYEYTNENDADQICPVAIDFREGRGFNEVGCWVNFVARRSDDSRTVLRFDTEYVVNDAHVFRFGMDHEDNVTHDVHGFSGPNFDSFQYFNVPPGLMFIDGNEIPAGVTELVQYRMFKGGGKFGAASLSFYVEDEWLVNESLNLRFGLRHERFENTNPEGATVIRIDDQWAPRFGVAWDLGGSTHDWGTIVASYSRYHLPLPNSVNTVLASGTLFTESLHLLGSEIQEDGSVELGTRIGPLITYADGSSPNTAEVVDASLKSMYQDEFTFGYSKEFPNEIHGGVDYTFRELGRVIEDITIDQVFERRSRYFNLTYVLTNPGSDLTFDYDANGDGVAETIHVDAEELGFPKPVRKYHALEFFVDKHLDSRLYLRGSYTWSHSYGNHEGLTRTDVARGGTLSGVTYQWDFLGLLDGAYGDLPNDRRHSIKVFGLWKLKESLHASFAWGLQDGRPRNAFGRHPTDRYARVYGSIAFYNNGELSPRGTLGRTERVSTLDIGLRYRRTTDMGGFVLSLDVFNLFDEEAIVDYNENSDSWFGRPDPNFGSPTWFQNPRTIRIGLVYELTPRNTKK